MSKEVPFIEIKTAKRLLTVYEFDKDKEIQIEIEETGIFDDGRSISAYLNADDARKLANYLFKLIDELK